MVFPAVEYGGQEKNLVLLSNELYKKNYDLEILSYGNKNFTTNQKLKHEDLEQLTKEDLLKINVKKDNIRKEIDELTKEFNDWFVKSYELSKKGE